MDAFTIAFRIPNCLRDCSGKARCDGLRHGVHAPPRCWRATPRLAARQQVATLTAVCLSAITVLGIITAPWLVARPAPGFDPARRRSP